MLQNQREYNGWKVSVKRREIQIFLFILRILKEIPKNLAFIILRQRLLGILILLLVFAFLRFNFSLGGLAFFAVVPFAGGTIFSVFSNDTEAQFHGAGFALCFTVFWLFWLLFLLLFLGCFFVFVCGGREGLNM